MHGSSIRTKCSGMVQRQWIFVIVYVDDASHYGKTIEQDVDVNKCKMNIQCNINELCD